MGEGAADPAGRSTPAPAVRVRIARARRLVVLTGPALAPDDATPAFSDCGTTFGGAEVRAVAAQQPFFEDPVAVWSWYDECRRRLAGVAPGAAHRALAEAERRAEAFTLATESVDGLHRRAGSRNVVELRGSVWQTHCTRCGLRSENHEVPIAMPPSCPLCTGLARPGVLWRGEEVPRPLLERCFEALRRCDALVVAGTPGGAQPAAAFIAVARRAGAFVVEVSADPRPGSAADALVVGPPDDVVPELFAS